MDSLTCGERFVRCLIGEPVDRVPFGVSLGWAPWGETYERWKKESGDPKLDVGKALGFDGSCVIPKFAPGIFPQFAWEKLEETADAVVFRDQRGIVMRQLKGCSNMPDFLQHPVQTRADWEKLKEERLQVDAPGRIDEDWNGFRARIGREGLAVQVGNFPYGVFGTVRDLMGLEGTLYGLYDEPDLIRDIMEHLTGLWIGLWERVAREVRIDHIHIWEDMSGRQGSLISPEMVEEFMMPCYDRIAAFGREHGVRVISVDTDGDCSGLVPIMMKHGVNMFFPFEVQAGNDIEAYRRQYPTLGIMCGLDKRALAVDRAAIDKEVGKAARMVERGRYVPGFDHLIPPDVSWENFCYACERIKRVCYGEAR